MGQKGRALVLEAVGHQQRPPAWCQDPSHLMHDALGHRQRAAAHIDDDPHLPLGGHRCPYPRRRVLQTLDGFILTAVAGLDLTQDGIQFLELQLLQVQVAEKIGGKGMELLGRFGQPVQHGVGATSKTRAVARIPKPSARQAKTRTMRSTSACLPWKIVPCGAKKYPLHAVQWNWRQGPPLGWPLALRWPRPPQPR